MPEWVPANALVHIDLVGGSPQGRAWVDGVGEGAVDTLFGEDANAENYWDGASGYDPGALTASGLVPSGVAAFIGAARTLLTTASGVSVVMQVTNSGVNGSGVIYISSASGNSAYKVTTAAHDDNGHADIIADVSGASFRVEADLVPFADGSKIGFTLAQPTSTGALSVNGGAAATSTIGASEWPVSGEEFVAAAYVLDNPADPVALGAITIYAPVNLSVLPALTS